MVASSPKEAYKTVSLRVLLMEKISMATHLLKTPLSLSKNLFNLKKSPSNYVNLFSPTTFQ